ncbi:MAG: peroxiredoxin, partial [Betaproteobacteria bacterium]|nr:peroxiredoxin [Betaproteobacteria bacterium]
LRCQRFSMVVDHGVVTHVSVEDAGKFEVSSAEAMLAQL